MPGEAWVGLNDINVENQFVYTDGTPAVSDKTRNNMQICFTMTPDTARDEAAFWCELFHSVDFRTSFRGGPTSQITGRIMRIVCTSEGWLTLNLGNSMMISALPQRNTSAKKVWLLLMCYSYASSCKHTVFSSYSLSCLSIAKGQGPPPQPPTSGPGQLDSTPIITLKQIICEFIWMWACMAWCVLHLLQGGMRNVALGMLTLLTTSATCLTSCQRGRGQKLELTASIREETSSVFLIPTNRPSYRVWLWQPHATAPVFFCI